jgi:hypothetical protein
MCCDGIRHLHYSPSALRLHYDHDDGGNVAPSTPITRRVFGIAQNCILLLLLLVDIVLLIDDDVSTSTPPPPPPPRPPPWSFVYHCLYCISCLQPQQ